MIVNNAKGSKRDGSPTTVLDEVLDIWEQQVQAIDMASKTTDNEIEELQAQPGMDLAKIRAYVVAGTVPE